MSSRPFAPSPLTGRIAIAACVLATLTWGRAVEGATIVKGNNSNALNLTTSYTGAVVPTAADVVQFDSTITTTALTPALGASLSWQGISVTNPGALVTIGATTGAVLTLGTSGISQASTTQDFTINAALALSAAQNWSTGTSGRTLTIGGAVNLGGFALTLNGAGTKTISGVLSNGSVAVTTGTSNLSAANTFAGGVTLSGGTVNLNNSGTTAGSSLGTGALTITGGTIGNAAGTAVTIATNNAQNWNGDFAFNSSQNLNLGTGAVTLSANRTVTTSGTGIFTVGGPIGESGAGFRLTKAGTGIMAIPGLNTYTGGTTVNAGTLSTGAGGTFGADVATNTIVANAGGNVAIGSSAAVGATQTVTINSDATGLGGVGIGYVAPAPTFTNNKATGVTVGGVFGINTTGYNLALDLATLGNGGMLLGSQLGGSYTATTLGADNGVYRLGGGAGTLTVTNAVITGANNLEIGDPRTNGTGTVVLSGANDFTGTTSVRGGSVSIADINNGTTDTASGLGGNNSAILLGSTAAGGLIFTGASDATVREITLGTGGGSITTTTSGATLTVGRVNGTTGTAFTKSGVGSVTTNTTQAQQFGTVSVNGDTIATLSAVAVYDTAAAASRLTLGSGGNTISGTLNVGNNSTAASLVVPGGAFSAGTGTANDLNIGSRNTGTSNFASVGVLDLSAASGATLNFNNIRLAFDYGTTGNGDMKGTLRLPTAAAATNTITAAVQMTVGTSGTQGSVLAGVDLGGGATTINTPILILAGPKSSSTMQFATGGASTEALTLKGVGTGRMALTVAQNNVNTGSSQTGALNATGGKFTASLSTLGVGLRSAGGVATSVGTLNTGTDTTSALDALSTGASTATIGSLNIALTGVTGSAATGALIMGGGTHSIANTNATGTAMILGTFGGSALTNGTNVATGTLTLNNAALTVTADATGGTAIAIGQVSGVTGTGNTAAGIINLNAGSSLTVNRPIVGGNTNLQASSTINVAGGTLNMGGSNITNVTSFNYSAGSVNNLNALSLGNGSSTVGGGQTLMTTAGITVGGTVGTGTLTVNGSIAGAVDTAVAANGVLRGFGTVSGVSVTGGVLSAGTGVNIPGTLDVGGNLALNTNAKLTLELGGVNPGDGAGNYSQVRVGSPSSSITLDSTATLNLSLSTSFVPTMGSVFYILTREDGAAFTTAFANAAEGATVNFGGLTGTVTYLANWTGAQGTSSLTGGNDVAVYNVVPEPSAALSVMGGVAMLLGLRRSRRRG